MGVEGFVKAPSSAEKAREVLDGSIRLAGGEDVVGRKSPPAEQMSHHSRLRAVERELLINIQREGLRNIQSGQSIFPRGEVERILRERHGSRPAKGAEYFAHVVGCLAPGIVGGHGQLFVEIRCAELNLEPVVKGIPGIGPFANNALVAIHSAQSSWNAWKRSSARCYVRGHSVREHSRRI